MTVLLGAVLVGLLLAGFPLFVPLFAAALAGLLAFFPSVPASLLVQQSIGAVQPAVLSAVPLFIFAADLMTRGQTALRLLDLVSSLVGHRRGGLAISAAAGCALFGAVSGSTQATVVAMGQPLRPRLLAAGYRDSFVLALIVSASDLALLIPPSIGMIVYGVIAGVSVGDLFIAGIGPGLLVLVMMSAYCRYAAGRQQVTPVERVPWRLRGRALRRAALPLGYPLIVVGGIYGGVFSPSEAAAVGVVYALVVEVLVYRAARLPDLARAALSTGMITSVVFILVGAGGAFAWVISYAQLPQALLGGVLPAVSGEPLMLLALLSVAYFVGCMFVDPIVVMLIFTPIFAPAVAASGADPLHVGVLVTLQAAIGSATPPFGCDLFTAMAVFRQPYTAVVRGTPPFIALLMLATVILILVPDIALTLPKWAASLR